MAVSITTTQTTANFLNATATTINFGGGATTGINIGNNSGTTTVNSALLLLPVRPLLLMANQLLTKWYKRCHI